MTEPSDRNITNAPDHRLDEAALSAPPAPSQPTAPPKPLEAASPEVRARIMGVLEDAALVEYLSEALKGSPTRFEVVRGLIAHVKSADADRRQEIGQTLLRLVIPNGIVVSGRTDVYWLLREMQDLGVQAIISLDPNNDDVRLGVEEDVTDPSREGAISLNRGDIEIDPLALKETKPQSRVLGATTWSGTQIIKPRQMVVGGEFVWKGGGLKLHEARVEE